MLKKLAVMLKIAPTAALIALACTPLPAVADDTEIYQADLTATNTNARPKVLIVLDDSGSMRTTVTGQRPSYDPNATYDVKFSADRIYWSTSANTPGVGHSRWFPASENRCASSYTDLAQNGNFGATDPKRWIDSTTIPGQCRNECPSGTTYRNPPGPNNAGCYQVQTVNEPNEKLVYNRNDWGGNRCYNGLTYVDPPGPNNDACYSVVTSAGNTDLGYVYRQNDSGNSCGSTGFIYLTVDPPGGGNRYDACFEEVTDAGTTPVTGWQYIGPRVQVCDVDTVVNGTWAALAQNDHSPTHVECANDITASNDGNGPGQGDGFPQDDQVNGDEYGPTLDGTITWSNTPYRFYTSHYLNWWHDASLIEDKSRMTIAQEVITTIIDTNKNVDFGLVEFNSDHGGRITHRIIEDMSLTQRDNLIDMVDRTSAGGWTPMCESMYEAYRYIAGEGVVFGDREGSNANDSEPKDDLAEVPGGGTYISPNTDCAYTYVILMTDGAPSQDNEANQAIRDLYLPDVVTCRSYLDDGGNMTENCLPLLTDYMATNDLDTSTDNGDQFAITYTIGFTTNLPVLVEAAGGNIGDTVDQTPRAYVADDAQSLADAFQGAILSILTDSTTFTSPAVAVDTFTRTQSRNEVFYAMFEPSDKVDWIGNIKKLQLNADTELVDSSLTNTAIDPATGAIKASAVTFWSTGADGPDVGKGGVGGLLAARDPATRTIYTNTGSGGALEAFNTTNIDAAAMGAANNTELYNLFGASNALAFAQQVGWAQGYDAYSPTPTNTRPWIVGDILHSQPLVINYGARGSFTAADPDLRLIVGTNAGFVHMFGNDNGHEDWAFFPKELAPILPLRQRNARTADHVYGMDLTAVTYTKDVNGDGTLDSSAGDKAWAFLGMRRGGRAYYALDVSNPDLPTFMWKIDKNTAGFSELGQSWSEPKVTKIPGHPNPVLIFGAGYDTGKDASGVGAADSEGRGIFIVDAATGALVWSITPAANSAKNMYEPGLLHSVPANVSILDSNRDLITDRIYFGDTGGNVWRVDLPGSLLPTGSQNTWTIVKLGAFNGSTAATDRRFFNAPDIVRIRLVDGSAADAILIGSGDQTNPNATDVDNRVYVLRDLATSPYQNANPSPSECAAVPRLAPYTNDFRCELPLGDGDLYDVSDNIINTGDAAEKAVALQSLKESHGWLFELPNAGEKNLAKILTLDGTMYVPTFTPSNILNEINVCSPQAGTGLLYVLDLYNGDRSIIPMGPIIPPTPSLHFTGPTGDTPGKITFLIPPGAPPSDGDVPCTGGTCDPGKGLRRPYGNYWFQEAY